MGASVWVHLGAFKAGLVMIWIRIPLFWFSLEGIQRLIGILSFSGAVLCIVMDYLF